MPSRFEFFSEQARRVLSNAQEESQLLGHRYIGTEHILLGLVREIERAGDDLFAALDLDPSEVRAAVERLLVRDGQSAPNGVGLTQPAKKVIELTVAHARGLNDPHVGIVSLLAGLVSEGGGVAAGVLRELGLTIGKISAVALSPAVHQSNRAPGMPWLAAEWPEDLERMAVGMKRAQKLRDLAVSRGEYELAAALIDEESMLNQQFERRYAEWVRSQMG